MLEVNSDSNLVLTYYCLNKIQIYNLQGKLLKETKIANLIEEIPDEYNKELYRLSKKMYPDDIAKKAALQLDKLIFRGMVVDQFDNVFVKGGDFSENGERKVIVLDKELNIKSKFLLPDKEEKLLHIDNDNYLYTTSEDKTILNKYKIIYE